ncbi:MAG: hypothetical protein AAB453_02005 [Patescibacteria group bacterium]
MKINQQKGSSLIVILLIDALLATGVVVLIFFLARAQRVTLAGATEIRELAEKRANVEMLSRLTTELKDFRPKLDPYFVEIDTLNERLKKIASSAGVDFQFQSINNSDFEKREALGITFSAEGPFNNVLQFTLLLENAPFKLFFNRVDLKLVDFPNAENKNTAWWSANFDITLLSFTPD